MRRWAGPITILTLLVVGIVVSQSRLGPAPPEHRPNVVLILADDLGYSDLGAYGSEIPTPNIDSLAASGVRFAQFYTTPKCHATRASLLTGLYWQQALDEMALSDRVVTLPETLRQAGYRTLMAGKWHLTGWRFDDPTLRPEARGFDKFFGSLIGEPYFQPKRLFRGGQPAAPGPGFYYTNAIADEVVSNLREVARDDVPFFYYVPFTAPHAPIEAPADSIDTHENVYEIDRDEIRRERQERLLELGLTQEPWWDCAPDPAIPRWERGGRRERETQFQQTYAAMVTDLDRAVGSIVSELDRTGMLDNTLVLVLSDNGATGSPVKTTYQARGRGWANVSNAPFRGYKSGPYEGGISSPLIAHWPNKIKAGLPVAAVAHVIDIYPTLLDAVGVEHPVSFRNRTTPPMEGVSLLPAIQGRRGVTRPIFWHWLDRGAVRRGRWKLVSWELKKRAWELYDLEEDRCESNDLAQRHPKIVSELEALFDAWRLRVGASSNHGRQQARP